jgi:hypothetical protein
MMEGGGDIESNPLEALRSLAQRISDMEAKAEAQARGLAAAKAENKKLLDVNSQMSLELSEVPFLSFLLIAFSFSLFLSLNLT